MCTVQGIIVLKKRPNFFKGNTIQFWQFKLIVNYKKIIVFENNIS